MSTFDRVQDSGERREFTTGSVRDKAAGKGRFDLIPEYCEQRLARHYENGAVKYEARNWEKGQPLSVYLSSCRRHWGKVLLNMQDEDHAAAVVWNMYGYMWTRNEIETGRLPKELDDLGHTMKAREPKQTASPNEAERVCLNCKRPIYKDPVAGVWRHSDDFRFVCEVDDNGDLSVATPLPVAVEDQKCIEKLTGRRVRETTAEHKAKVLAMFEGGPVVWTEATPPGMETEVDAQLRASYEEHYGKPSENGAKLAEFIRRVEADAARKEAADVEPPASPKKG